MNHTDSCTPQSTSADTCHVAKAEILVSGDDNGTAATEIGSSLESILENDQAFRDEINMNGIVDVRLKDSSSEEAALQSTLDSENDSISARSAVVAVLSVAAAAVVVAGLMTKRMGRGAAGGDDLKEGHDSDSDSDSYDDTVPITLAGTAASTVHV